MGRILEWGASLLCVVFLVLWFRDRPLPDLFVSQASTAWVLAAVGSFGASLCLVGERWHYLLRREASTAMRGTAYRSIGLAEVANMLLPMRAGDALQVSLVSQREKRPLSSSVGVMVVERALALTTLLGFLTVTGVLVLSRVPGAVRSPWTAGLVLLLLASAAVAIGWGMVTASRAVVRFAPWPPIASLAAPLARLTAGGMAIAFGLSVAIFSVEGLAWWAAARSVDMSFSLLEALFIQAVATLAIVVPAGPGSVGTLDAAIVVALGYVGHPGGDSLGFIVTLRLVMLVACVGFWLSVSGQDLFMRLAPRDASR